MSEIGEVSVPIPTVPETAQPSEMGPRTQQIVGAMHGLTDREGLLFQIENDEFKTANISLIEDLQHANDAQQGKEGTAYEAITGYFMWTDEQGNSHDGNVL